MPIYLQQCFIENAEPISQLDLSLRLNADGSPQPVVLVGKNGSGKTVLASQIADALIEIARLGFADVRGDDRTRFFKVVATTNVQAGKHHSLCLCSFGDRQQPLFHYIEQTGTADLNKTHAGILHRFGDVHRGMHPGNAKHVVADVNTVRNFFVLI